MLARKPSPKRCKNKSNIEFGVASTSCLSQQNERSRKQEHQVSSDKKVFTGRTDRDVSDESDNDDKEDTQDPVSNNNPEQHESVLSSDSCSDKEDQLKKIDSFMVRHATLYIS